MTERRREYTNLGLDLGKREEQVACYASKFGLGDDRRSTSGSGDVNLTIFIACMSCCESLTSFTNGFFHFSGPPGFRTMRPKGMEDLAAFSIREVKRAEAEEREREKYFSAEGQ